jgi:hypothetical protein
MNQLTHYAQAGLRGLFSGTLFKTGAEFLRYRRIERAVVERYGLVVQDGIFKGMKYVPIIPNHCLIPKLLGIYEQELHGCVRDAIARGYDLVVDVGSAEGYYVVGLARALPQTRFHAFDAEARERQMLRDMATANGVLDRITIGGLCEPETLDGLIAGRTLVIVDCEGGEMAVLDPARAPRLADADILVEIHDFDGGDRVGSALRSRFAATHDLTVISSVPRRPEDHPLVAFLPSEEDRRRAVMERAAIQDWYFFRSRTVR